MSALLAPDALSVQTLISYYARKNLHHHVFTAASQALVKRTNDPVLLFWKGYAVLREGKQADAIRELDLLRGKQGVQLPVLLCLKIAHEGFKLQDREALQGIKEEIFQEEKGNREGSFFLAAMVSMLLGDYKKAREYVTRTIEIMPTAPQAKSLAGWIDLLCGSDSKAKKSLALFEEAAEQNPKDVDAQLGRSAYYAQHRDVDRAIDLMNEVLIKNQWFTPAVTEKAHLLFAIADWDQAIETAKRALALDPNSIDALTLTVVHLLAHDSNFPAACSRIGELSEVLRENEPNNAPLYASSAAIFARLCARNSPILTQCAEMIGHAVRLDATSADVKVEMAYQFYLSGNYSKAYSCYQDASKLDEANMTALYGMIKCQIFEGQLDDASGQFEFLNEIHSGPGAPADLSYIGALLATRKDHDAEQTVVKLEETVRIHMEHSGLKDGKLSVANITKFDPDLLIQIATELLGHAGADPVPPGETPPQSVSKCMRVLDQVSRVAPGMLEARVLQARARYLSRDFDGAQSVLADAISLDPSHASSHMLMAQIFIEMERFRDANASLEQALSHHFEIRESPTYFLLRAQVHQRMAEWPQALKVLESAMALPGVKGGPGAGKGKGGKPVALDQRAAIYLNLAKVHAELEHTPEATKIIQDARAEFQGSTVSSQIIIVDAEISLKRGDVQSALVLLKSVSRGDPYYLKARVATASIHLNHRNNKKLYIRAYEDLVDAEKPTISTVCMLADAYMRLQEPEKAVEQLQRAELMEEKAIKDGLISSGPSELAGKIGKAKVLMHKFTDAIEYYKKAVTKQPKHVWLSLALADLHMKLGRFPDAISVIDAALDQLKTQEGLEMLTSRSKLILLQAQVHKRAGAVDQYTKSLLSARDNHTTILARVRGEAAEMVKQQRKVAANICQELARHLEDTKKYDEALKALLLHDLEHETATMMLADIMFRSNDFDEAIRYFAQLLELKPNNYRALEQLILLVRRAGRLVEKDRAGKLGEAPRFLRLAEKASPRAELEAGFHYCKGLYARYSRNFHEALSELNQARKDPEWGSKAIRHMIDIYLDPDSLPPVTTILPASGPEPEPVRMARQLRSELVSEKPVKIALLAAYELLLSVNKVSVEGSLVKFTEVLTTDPNNVSALLGSSYALVLLKQDAKARNHLKRISKMQYNSEEAEELEKSYLLLADIYVQSNKNDLAQELCRKCLTHNKSCVKAWEIQGLIYEKEASFADAAQVYEMAWKFDNQRSPAVGFKLAFNYLKAKRFLDAINICHIVLAVQPDYPKIKKEILDKARAAIRP
ncbi:hypothetical protein T484DRAFT_1668725 [Baffinella frigidus]|nr:hypothetical protein T484DRAFT_1668725 [Cryptophyta sp. CCMP2293]